MSLFQICYGPEIGSILQTVQKNPGIARSELIAKYQYQPEGDISSLMDAALIFLMNLHFIKLDELKHIWPLHHSEVKDFHYLQRLKEIAEESNNPADSNYIFSTMYYYLFVVPNQLYIKDLHYEANLKFDKLAISQEKVNAWKRMMEYFGLGYRVYGGFYALPQLNLMKSVVKEIGPWEGPLQLFFEKKINSIIPCVHNGSVFNGMVFAVLNLGNDSILRLSKKQDLPYTSFGEKKEWNWVKIGGEIA
ncbi:hypothetical protein [Bacillus sp. X1(2014)]|uniref:hypothetical protein n=1 Tax=Bacillus sp. X1(2014) TaxID=1565991 RepID=UPI0011A1DEBE|nr:hypothetical protein [Bacillus sp. X1(2014)]